MYVLSKEKTLTLWSGFENVKAKKKIPGPKITCSHKYKPRTLITNILILVIAELHACKRSPIVKKIWLSIHPRNFGSHMTVHPSVSPQGNQGEMLHFLASVGACNMILHILVMVNKLSAVKTRYLLTSITWPYGGLQCWPIKVTHLFYVLRRQVTSFELIAGSIPGGFLCNDNKFIVWSKLYTY